MGSSALLLKPIGLFRKELASNKRAQSALTKLAHQEMYQPLLMQQILGCSLLQAIDPDSLMVRRFRERSDNNLDFIRRIKHEQITEERWERYYDDVINRSENEAIESLRDEGYVPLGTSESWLEDILAATTGQEDPSPL